MHILMDDGRLVHAKMGPGGHWVPDEQDLKGAEQERVMSEPDLSDAWQCQSCGCYFPHIPKILDNDVKRCSKCVQVEALEARLSKMERAAINSPCRISIKPDKVVIHCDGCKRLHELGREALAGESDE